MPTPSPIIVARVGATVGTEITCPNNPITDVAIARATAAVRIGRPIATRLPNTSARITIAERLPISSLVLVSGCESSLPIGPPTATWRPAFAGRLGRRQRLVRELLGDEPRIDVEQDGHECDRAVVAHEARRLPVLRQRVHDARHVRRVPHAPIGLVDRIMGRLLGQPSLVHGEDERARAVLLRREPFRQEIERSLAVGAGQRELVVRLGADRPDGQHRHEDHDDQAPDTRSR